jgi:hypothetical protein
VKESFLFSQKGLNVSKGDDEQELYDRTLGNISVFIPGPTAKFVILDSRPCVLPAANWQFY